MNKLNLINYIKPRCLTFLIKSILSILLNSLVFDIILDLIAKQFIINPFATETPAWLTNLTIFFTVVSFVLILADYFLVESITRRVLAQKQEQQRKKTKSPAKQRSRISHRRRKKQRGVRIMSTTKTKTNNTRVSNLMKTNLLICTSLLNVFYSGILINKHVFYCFFSSRPSNARISASPNVSKTDYLDEENDEFYYYLYGNDYGFKWLKYVSLMIDIAFQLGLYVLVVLYHIFILADDKL